MANSDPTYRAFVFRLYPTESQRRRLESVRETCRRFWNKCLAERKEAYEKDGVTISGRQQYERVKVEKAENPFAKGIPVHVLRNVVDDLDRAFQAFFRRVKAKEKPGYPRFKGRHRSHSFGYQQYGNGFKIDGTRLRLTWIGRIPVRWHRPLEGRIKTARIRTRAGDWFVSFVCENSSSRPLPKTGESIGIDLGLHRLATLSNGEGIENPRWYRNALRKLRIAERAKDRRKLGGSNRRKAILRIQCINRKITDVRKDFLFKLADDLISRFDFIALEDLNVSGMARGHFALSIHDASWTAFVTRLKQKAEQTGRTVVLVDPSGTSKTCSGCGRVFEGLTLKDRWVNCECGVSLDRDHNAAINILRRGEGILPTSGLGQSLRAPSSSMDGLAREPGRREARRNGRGPRAATPDPSIPQRPKSRTPVQRTLFDISPKPGD